MNDLFIFSAAAGCLGAIIGSFLNALSFRYHTGTGMGGHSKCMRCGVELSARDLVPLFSYLFLRGRCRRCGSGISLQYPLVEAAAALLGAGTYFLHPLPLSFAFYTLVWAVLLFIVVYDLRHSVLPSAALALLCILGILSLYFPCDVFCTFASPNLFALLTGPLLGVPLLLLSFFSKGAWMGWGDGILAVAFGWLLGLPAGVLALLIAFWSGSLVGVALMAWSKIAETKEAGHTPGYTIRSAIPFAPFMALGAIAVHAFHLDIFSLLL